MFTIGEKHQRKIFLRVEPFPALRAGKAVLTDCFCLQERGEKSKIFVRVGLPPRAPRGEAVLADCFCLQERGEKSKIFLRVELPPRAARWEAVLADCFCLQERGEKSKIFLRVGLPPRAPRGGCKGTGGFSFTRARGQAMQIFRAASALALTPKFKFCNSIIHKLVL